MPGQGLRSDRRRPSPLPRQAQVACSLLTERGLLAGWYIEYRLNEEMERSRRRGYPVSVALLCPVPLKDGGMSLMALAQAAAAARAAARITDLIGWLDQTDILVVLPDTDDAGAQAALARWRTQMGQHDRHEWRVAALERASDYASVEDVVDALRARAKVAY
jgi:hypothetical protein